MFTQAVKAPNVKDVPLLNRINSLNLTNEEKSALTQPIMSGNYDLAFRRCIFGIRKNSNYKQLVPLLLGKITNIHLTSKAQGNKSVLHFAAEIGAIDTIQMLLNAGAYINMIDDNWDTPLHLAIRNNHLEAAEILADNGALCTFNKNDEGPLKSYLAGRDKAELSGDEIAFCTKIEANTKPDHENPNLEEQRNKFSWLEQRYGMFVFPKDDPVLEKIDELTTHRKLHLISINHLLEAERNYGVTFLFFITRILKLPDLNLSTNNLYLCDLSQEELGKIPALANLIVELEQRFKMKFDFIVQQSYSLVGSFIKSTSKIEIDISHVPNELYKMQDGVLLIQTKHIDAFLSHIDPQFKQDEIYTPHSSIKY